MSWGSVTLPELLFGGFGYVGLWYARRNLRRAGRRFAFRAGPPAWNAMQLLTAVVFRSLHRGFCLALLICAALGTYHAAVGPINPNVPVTRLGIATSAGIIALEAVVVWLSWYLDSRERRMRRLASSGRSRGDGDGA